MSFYEMIPAYLKRFDPEKLEYRFQADTIEEHQSWRKRAEKRLWEIAGIGLCEQSQRRKSLHRCRKMDIRLRHGLSKQSQKSGCRLICIAL